ncbi:type I polyketide synthase [Oscillatoria acuminata]|uniref:Phenolphthiocerol/phthiocerol polyketide synthase subunit E n=1 Tax=Oscillatoria acuminata PCC 6304 TaxID=56110 RepID=K9TCP9_9CYAN|nr:type I polyketide synthase [Oscillatoria acuminata]AFY80290.1 polyketide synthase family protein [Oscillatoria acuminata PCC 6304]
MDNQNSLDSSVPGIAIIGMTGRFPGAKTLEEFWDNLRNGVESIAVLSEEELLASSLAAEQVQHPNYVKAKGVLDDVEWFDASFFGLTPKDAEITDPQHRFFLECAWEALEHSGYNPENYPGLIGVYAGSGGGLKSYLFKNLYLNPQIQTCTSEYQLSIANEKDFLPSKLSYKLKLTGPSVAVQTACSTSLVAVSMACQSLLTYQCDMALAGGVAMTFPQKEGYLYQPGMILSPDGHCRAFDANAKGTVSGNGLGIVVLKRLEEAIADGDFIHAVIRGSAINNDGGLKVGYTAPSIEGQAEAIAQAQAVAEVDPETITYIEAHGTGTPLGDPIEIAALTEVFSRHTDKTGFCAVGSVKTNIGHLDTAAGIAGLIKTVLALKHQQIPPSLHFQQPNPQINFETSPFYVNATLTDWKTNGTPRRAGVSSFGIGGTNAHVILEEAPVRPRQDPGSSGVGLTPHLLLLSAKTPSALNRATANLAAHLRANPEVNLADVAYTLAVGRKAFPYRRRVVAATVEEAIARLEAVDSQPVITPVPDKGDRPVVFLFSGQGTQYIKMAQELYHTQPRFQGEIDRCCQLLQPLIGLDLREILYPPDATVAEATTQLKQTAITQPALFTIEYALAQLWTSWGIQPVAAIGHSIGEYVAACIAGVFSLEDALSLVAKRGQLMQQMPPGSMVAVPLPESELQPFLNSDLSLALINGPGNCVVSGPVEAVQRCQQQLSDRAIECRTLHTSHAFHSPMMEPMLPAFTAAVQQVTLNSPKIPYISNVTGTWITPSQATNPDYWAQHLRQTVRFAEGLATLFKQSDWGLLEVGPGRSLTTLAKRHPNKGKDALILSSLRHPQDEQSDLNLLFTGLGQLWEAGVAVDWEQFYAGQQRDRLPLPTYPFERQRYWIEPENKAQTQVSIPSPGLTPAIWNAMVQAAQSRSQQGLSEFDNPTYLHKKQQLEALCRAYIHRTVHELGAFQQPTEGYTLSQFLEKFEILPQYQQLWARCLNGLVDQGQLQQQGEQFIQLVPYSPESFQALLAQVRDLWADTPDYLQLVECCGDRYAAILTGTEDPLNLLFTGPNAETLQRVYQNSPESHYYVGIMAATLQALVKSWPSDRTLRILEVGGGTGSATMYLLKELPEDRTSYRFTDVGLLFIKQAEQKFKDYPFVEYQRLDLDQDPMTQGYTPESFDLIIASQVIHATRHLSQTLERVRTLLAPGGFLMMWEGTNPRDLSFDVAFPLLQRIEEEELRSLYAFLSLDQWQQALAKHGFVQATAAPLSQSVSEHILIAQTAGLPQSTPVSPHPSSIPMSPNSPRKTDGAILLPRNSLEEAIASVWQQYLGIASISIHNDFFELGGDSLVAVQVLSQLREQFHTELPNHTLLEAPTIAELAEFMAKLSPTPLEPQSALPSCLVNIQSGSGTQPLFLIHPAGGHVYIYRDLVRQLDENLSVYGLQARGLDGKLAPLDEIPAMAEYYLDALRQVQPKGPYRIGGASFGGIVAFEMAQQLQASGERVELLTIFDCAGPEQLPAGFEEDEVQILSYLLGVGGNLSISCDRLRQLEPEDRFRYFLAQGRDSIRLPSDFGLQELQHYLEMFKRNVRAMRRYHLRPYPGRIVFFRASDRDEISPGDPERAWLELATDGVEIYEVPGNHITMNFAPHVKAIADPLTIALQDARSL